MFKNIKESYEYYCNECKRYKKYCDDTYHLKPTDYKWEGSYQHKEK